MILHFLFHQVFFIPCLLSLGVFEAAEPKLLTLLLQPLGYFIDLHGFNSHIFAPKCLIRILKTSEIQDINV